MFVYWVNYDLNKAGQDYADLIMYLKSHQSWAKPLKSSFFVKTSLSVSQLRDGAMQYIDANDSIVVVAVSGQNWAAFDIDKRVSDWLLLNL